MGDPIHIITETRKEWKDRQDKEELGKFLLFIIIGFFIMGGIGFLFYSLGFSSTISFIISVILYGVLIFSFKYRNFKLIGIIVLGLIILWTIGYLLYSRGILFTNLFKLKYILIGLIILVVVILLVKKRSHRRKPIRPQGRKSFKSWRRSRGRFRPRFKPKYKGRFRPRYRRRR